MVSLPILMQTKNPLRKYLLAVRDGTVGDRNPPVPREVLPLHSLLQDDPDGLLMNAAAPLASDTYVGPDGQVFFDRSSARMARLIGAVKAWCTESSRVHSAWPM